MRLPLMAALLPMRRHEEDGFQHGWWQRAGPEFGGQLLE
jgi:hypothetical protein